MLYVSQITGENPIEKILENNLISKEQVSQKLAKLIQKNLISEDKMTLTEIGRWRKSGDRPRSRNRRRRMLRN